mmetsp:Transcript_16939/g.55576  ORF Transcript_16939/g.55576 Transcript_16939/m.55576 type:complete len:327 (+) Transcript_16939:77-1057(+)
MTSSGEHVIAFLYYLLEEELRDPRRCVREPPLLKRLLVRHALLLVRRHSVARLREACPRLVLVRHRVDCVFGTHKVEDRDLGVKIGHLRHAVRHLRGWHQLVQVEIHLRKSHRQRVDGDQGLGSPVLLPEDWVQLDRGRRRNGAALAVSADDHLAPAARAQRLRLLLKEVDELLDCGVELVATDDVVVRKGLSIEVGKVRVPTTIGKSRRGGVGADRRAVWPLVVLAALWRCRENVLDAARLIRAEAVDKLRKVGATLRQPWVVLPPRVRAKVLAVPIEPVKHDDRVRVSSSGLDDDRLVQKIGVASLLLLYRPLACDGLLHCVGL